MTGTIYRIRANIDDFPEEETYYGSTLTDIKTRFRYHLNDYGKYKRGLKFSCRSFQLFDKYGKENCLIEPVQTFDAISVQELKKIEKEQYIQIRPCINKHGKLPISATNKREYFQQYFKLRQIK
jgi:hypothetical protein